MYVSNDVCMHYLQELERSLLVLLPLSKPQFLSVNLRQTDKFGFLLVFQPIWIKISMKIHVVLWTIYIGGTFHHISCTYIVKFHICNSTTFEPRQRIQIFFIHVYARTLFGIYDKGSQSCDIVTLIRRILQRSNMSPYDKNICIDCICYPRLYSIENKISCENESKYKYKRYQYLSNSISLIFIHYIVVSERCVMALIFWKWNS